jgi:hypothetical protein
VAWRDAAPEIRTEGSEETGNGERLCPEEMGHGLMGFVIESFLLRVSRVNNPHPSTQSRRKYIYPSSSATSPTLIFITS